MYLTCKFQPIKLLYLKSTTNLITLHILITYDCYTTFVLQISESWFPSSQSYCCCTFTRLSRTCVTTSWCKRRDGERKYKKLQVSGDKILRLAEERLKNTIGKKQYSWYLEWREHLDNFCNRNDSCFFFLGEDKRYLSCLLIYSFYLC